MFSPLSASDQCIQVPEGPVLQPTEWRECAQTQQPTAEADAGAGLPKNRVQVKAS